MTIKTAMARKGAMLAAAGFSALAMAGQAHAAAFYLQEQSVRAIGRAFSGEVADTGSASMWWNPAAIGGATGIDGYLGASAILPRADSSDRGTMVVRPNPADPAHPIVSPVGGDPNQHNPINNGVLPSGGFAIPIGSRLAVGVVATSPYSFTTDYDADSWARYDADKTRLRTYDIQPTIAIMPVPGLSIGAGVNIERTTATLSNKLPDPISAQLPDAEQTLRGSGWDVGWSFGFQYRGPVVDLGVSYKSAIRHKLKGSFVIAGNQNPVLASQINQSIDGIHASFRTPWQVNVGARVHASDRLTIDGQITRFGWSRFDQISLPDLGSALPEDYKNTWSYALGLDYAVTPQWTMRAGVQRDLSPIRSGYRDPRVPDGNRWNFALGTSYALSPHFTIDAAASYDKIASNPIDRNNAAYVGTPLQTVILTSGELHNAKAFVFGLGGRVSF